MIDLTWDQVHALEVSAAAAERERIIKFFEDEADKFEAMRPEWYKSVADKMDFRIRTIRAMAKRLKDQDSAWSDSVASLKEEWPL